MPSVGESVPGFEASTWQGIGAPKNTPAEIVAKLNQGDQCRRSPIPKSRRVLPTSAAAPMPMSPAAFEKLIVAETAKWAKVIHEADIKLQ